MAKRKRKPPLGPRRLPTREELLDLDTVELERVLKRFGVEVDNAALNAIADNVYSQIDIAIEQGVADLDPATWQALDAKLDRAFNDAIRRQLKSVMRQHREASLRSWPGEFIWIATMTNTCDSCEARHGVVRTMRGWKRSGMPGSAVLVCRDNCNCELLPIAEEQDIEVELDIL